MSACRRRARLVILGVGAAALLTAILIATRVPSGTELREYVSPPLDASGTRLRLVHPRTWAVSPSQPLRPDPRTARQRRTTDYIYVTMSPQRQRSVWWERLSRLWLVRASPDPLASYEYLDVQVLPYRSAAPQKKPAPVGTERVVTYTDAPPGQPRVARYVSYREWLSPDWKRLFVVRYQRARRTAFDRTHHAISFGLRLQ